MKIYRLLLTLFALFLAGCAAATSTPLAAPTQATATSAPAPVASQPTPTVLPEPTLQPAAQATATPDARQQEQAAILPLVTPCNFADQAVSYSPSRAWVMVTCLGEDGAITKLARMDGSKQWSLSFAEIFLKPYQRQGVDPQKSFIPVRWTKNEDFVYLAGQTSSAETPFKGFDGLFLVNLSTGRNRSILNPAIAPLAATYAFQFSPSGIKLAYINQSIQPITIVLYDTQTGAENKISLDARFSQGGSPLWSTDEKQLAVSAFDAGKNGGNSVIVYDLETMENEFVIQQSANVYVLVEWVTPYTIYAQDNAGNWVYIDLTTKSVSPAPAPTPVSLTAAQISASKLTTQSTKESDTNLPAEITDSKGVAMRLIPAGEFIFGENASSHAVYLDGYYMDVYEVTNALYKACVDAGVCNPPTETNTIRHLLYYGNSSYDNAPVVNVTWYKAKAYCEWRGARLPTEAEWEKAARGTDGRTYPWGEEINSTYANFNWLFNNPMPVGRYEKGKSPYGMYDMAGNAMEWVADQYGVTNPGNSPDTHLLRGGAWYSNEYALRVTRRTRYQPACSDCMDKGAGFRCASSPQR